MAFYSFDRPTRLRADATRLTRVPHRRRQRRTDVTRLRGGYYQEWAENEADRTGVPTLGVLQDVSEGSARLVSGLTAAEITADDGDLEGVTAVAPESVNARFSGGTYRLAAGAASTQFSWGSSYSVGDQVQVRITDPGGDVFENYTPYTILSIESGTNRIFFNSDQPLPNPDDFSLKAIAQVAYATGTFISMVKIEDLKNPHQQRL